MLGKGGGGFSMNSIVSKSYAKCLMQVCNSAYENTSQKPQKQGVSARTLVDRNDSDVKKNTVEEEFKSLTELAGITKVSNCEELGETDAFSAVEMMTNALVGANDELSSSRMNKISFFGSDEVFLKTI